MKDADGRRPGPMNLRIPALVAVAFLLLPSPTRAQTIEVGLEVTESTGGIFHQRFDSILSTLDGVEVAGRRELADYMVTVTVLCLPDSEVCDTADSYSVSVTLSEPLTPSELRSGLARTGSDALSGWRASPEAAAYLQRFRRMHATWATSWARDRWGARVDRLVRGIDARCFEKRRILESRREGLLRRGDTVAARNLTGDALSDQDWLC